MKEMPINEKAKNKIAWAKTQLFLEHPFFGCLGMRLKFIQSLEIDTLCTDGSRLIYNPEFLLSLSNPEILGVLVHEIMHNAMLHPYRGGTRNHERWNYACDLAINGIILDMKFSLPKGILHDPKYKGMPAEQIYAKLPEEKGGGGNGKGKNVFDPSGPTGYFDKPGKPDPNGDQNKGNSPNGPVEEMSEVDWQMAVEQATVLAKKADKLPGNMDRTIKDGQPSNQDWRQLLWQFIENTLPSDYSWSRPNRRFIHQDIYLPSLLKENSPKFYLVVDTSGSIGPDDLKLIKPELDAILQSVKPEMIDIIYCDSRVAGREQVTPEEGDLFSMSPKGGGGTEFQPAIDEIAKDPEPGKAIIWFTDTYASDLHHLTPPEQDVLWLIPERYAPEKMPFGTIVKLSQY